MTGAGEHGTRERILAVAETFLGDFGYHGTRLHQIAQQVGIQKASLFHYFASKADLYHAVIEEGFGETEQTVRRVLEAPTAPLVKACALVEAYVDMVAAHPARTKIFLRQSFGDAPAGFERALDLQRLLSLVVGFIADGQAARAFAPVDPLALVLSIIGMVAFFFTSAPVVVPGFAEPGSASVARIKQHAVTVVQRCLTDGEPPKLAAAEAAA